MRTPERFDTLLDRAVTGPYPDRCYCPAHFPGTPPAADWRTRFATPGWDGLRAMAALNIPLADYQKYERMWAFQDLLYGRGQTDGSAGKDGIWLNKRATMPIRTVAHELAHVLLGHTQFPACDCTPMQLKVIETEAMATAMLVADALGCYDDADSALKQIATDDAHRPILLIVPERRARIKDAARRILTAGMTEGASDERSEYRHRPAA